MKTKSTTRNKWLSKIVFSLLWFGGYAQVTDKLKLVWNDEFNGNSIDSTKWKPAPNWFRQGGCYWADENFEMTGTGQVRLKVTEEENTVKCGAIRTRDLFDKKYGYFEVRCTVPSMHGGWGAFWLMPYKNNPGSLGNDGTEIDVFESINGWRGMINHALHWDGYGEYHQKDNIKFSRPDLYDDKYHIFGLMWTPNEYIFYIDNKETWRTTSGGVSDVNQYLKLTLEVSDGNWAGSWKDQVKKPIYWLVDYVRVYDYQIEEVELKFTSLTNDQSFHVGDQVQMHVDVSGSLSQIDEIKFITQKEDEADITQKTSKISGETTYWYNWFPNKLGAYKLKALGYKSGTYVTNVVVNAIVIDNLGPVKVEFASLNPGDKYTTGEKVKMDVILTGNLSQVDQIQYLTKQGDGEFIVQKTETLSDTSTYFFDWMPTVSATYSFRVTALKDGQYVTHVVAGGIEVEEGNANPAKVEFASLNSGEKYTIGEKVKMDVILTGNRSQVDQIQYLTKQDDGEFIVQKTETLSDASTYFFDWMPTVSATYSFRVTALKDGQYVTHVVAGGIEVEEDLNPLSLQFTVLKSGAVYNVGDQVKMHVELSGDYASIDEIKFISKRGEESGSVLKKREVLPDREVYHKTWIPTIAGTYQLKVKAFNSGSFVTSVTAHITVKENDSY